MRRSALVVMTLALLYPAAAFADGGPSPGVMQGWDGVASPTRQVRYVAFVVGSKTLITTVRRDGGRVVQFTEVRGQWGIPLVAFNGDAAGVSADGSTLVLGDVARTASLRKRSSFLVVDARTLRIRTVLRLPGDFAVDALSPDAQTLYLIQHVDARDLTRYVVRSYDLTRGHLNAGVIADKTQAGWVMAGWPVRRATSADGRWAYTVYSRSGGYPFVHVLDTVNGTAHCVGIPWRGSQVGLWRLKLRIGADGLVMDRHNGTPFATITVPTFRFVRAPTPTRAGFPWWIVLVCGAALVASAAAYRFTRWPGSIPRIQLRRSRTARASSG